VTTVLIPSLRTITDPHHRLELFEKLEGKFGFQAKLSTLVTGISGYFMLLTINGWERFQHLQFWWMHLMVFIWAVFTVVLFVLEPLFLHRWFRKQALANSDIAFTWLLRMHLILLVLSMLAVFGAVAGSHGFSF